MPSPFFNTVNAVGEKLSTYEAKASSQEAVILAHMRQHPGRMFTPSELHAKLFDHLVPITSIRRSVTNLSKAGHLKKTDIRVTGPYGMPEHCWYAPRPVAAPTQMGLF